MDLRGKYADDSLSTLELAALDWLDGFYQLEHLLDARAWTIRLTGGTASLELKFAALVHDAERFFPGGPSNTPKDGFDNPDYLFAHSLRSADIVDDWLESRPDAPDPAFRKRVRAIILRHELGGNPEQDVMQAADSLAFLATFDWLVASWVAEGHYDVSGVMEKLDWMLTRMRLPQALEWALPHYTHIASILGKAQYSKLDTAERRRQAGDKGLLLGLSSFADSA
jgi:hypothetical protein